jgi:hypothetical protein
MQQAHRSLRRRTPVNSRTANVPWKGALGLIIILITISIIAYHLSSIGGFIAGVLAVFVGLIVSFFRTDLKRILGLEKEEEYRDVPTVEVDADKKELRKLEKKIGKERTKLAKTMAEFDDSLPEKKKRKLDQEILEHSTLVVALLDQAKARAIHLGATDLVTHYNEIQVEVEDIRQAASNRLRN